MGEKTTRDESRRRKKKEKKRNRTTPAWMVVGAYTKHKETNRDRPPQRSRKLQPPQQVPESPPLFRSRQAAWLKDQGDRSRQAAWLKDQGDLLKGLAEIIMARLDMASLQLEELCKQELRYQDGKGGAAGNNNGEGGATQDPSLWAFETGSFPPCGDIDSTRGDDHTSEDTFFQFGRSSVVVSHAREWSSQSRQGWAAGFRKGFGKGQQVALKIKGCWGKGCWVRIPDSGMIDGGDVDGVTPAQSTADNGGGVLLGADGLPW